MNIKAVDVAVVILAVAAFIRITDGTDFSRRIKGVKVDPETKQIVAEFNENAIEA